MSRTAATTAHCANVTASTPPRARHTQHGTQLRPPHTPHTKNHTKPHTRPPRHTHSRAVRLRSVDGMLPESWLPCKPNCLQDTRTAIASHHDTRRRRPQPAARNASRRRASIKSNQIKSNGKPVSTLHAIAHVQHRVRVTPKTTQPDSPQVPDAVIPLDNAVTQRRSRTSQRNDSDTMHVQTSARRKTTTATANSE
jgi:hypothetical protein